jgi:hypothetical protein
MHCHKGRSSQAEETRYGLTWVEAFAPTKRFNITARTRKAQPGL